MFEWLFSVGGTMFTCTPLEPALAKCVSRPPSHRAPPAPPFEPAQTKNNSRLSKHQAQRRARMPNISFFSWRVSQRVGGGPERADNSKQETAKRETRTKRAPLRKTKSNVVSFERRAGVSRNTHILKKVFVVPMVWRRVFNWRNVFWGVFVVAYSFFCVPPVWQNPNTYFV